MEGGVKFPLTELLPVPYVHLVFTIPHSLNGLAGSHFRLITDLLFAQAAQTLIAFGANLRWLGGMLAFSLVLHTWVQSLLRHLHVHALVANGALGADGQWITGERRFLFPVKGLSSVFREKFIDALIKTCREQRLDQTMNDDLLSVLFYMIRENGLALIKRAEWLTANCALDKMRKRCQAVIETIKFLKFLKSGLKIGWFFEPELIYS